MEQLAISLCSVIFVWVIFPRVALVCDRSVTRSRFHLPHHTIINTAQPAVNVLSDVDICESLARSLRAGLHPRDALESLANKRLLPPVLCECVLASHDQPFRTLLAAIKEATLGTPHALFGKLLCHAATNETLTPRSLSAIAEVLRDLSHRQSQAEVGASHARLTRQILVAFPIAFLICGIMVSSNLRSALSQPVTLVSVALGIILNVIGNIWMKRLTSSIINRHVITPLHELMFCTVASLRSGLSLVESCLRWRQVNDVGQEVAHLLDNQRTLHDALSPLQSLQDTFGATVRQVIVECHSSGSPVSTVVDRLNDELHTNLQLASDIQLRQLPTKLTLPIVLCCLPAFLLLALIPVVLAGITTLPSPAIA